MFKNYQPLITGIIKIMRYDHASPDNTIINRRILYCLGFSNLQHQNILQIELKLQSSIKDQTTPIVLIVPGERIISLDKYSTKFDLLLFLISLSFMSSLTSYLCWCVTDLIITSYIIFHNNIRTILYFLQFKIFKAL